MFLRKTMRYYRLWIYGVNLIIFLGALVFLLSSLYVASDFRFRLIVTPRNKLAQEAGNSSSQYSQAEQSALASIISNSSNQAVTEQSAREQEEELDGREFGVNLSEPILLLAYLVVGLQLGFLQALGCWGATRMKEQLIQAFWYLILGLILFDVVYLIHWLQRYNVMLETLQNEMVHRLHNHYARTHQHSLVEAPTAHEQLDFDRMFTQIFDRIQLESHCCGVQSSLDYRRSKWRLQRIGELIQEFVKINGSAVLEDQELMKLIRQVPLVPASCCRPLANERLERNRFDGFEDRETAANVRKRPVIPLDDSQLPQQVRVPAWSPSMVVEDLVIGPGAGPSGSWRAGSNGDKDKRRKSSVASENTKPHPVEQLNGNRNRLAGTMSAEPTLADVIDRRWLAGRHTSLDSIHLQGSDDGDVDGRTETNQDRLNENNVAEKRRHQSKLAVHGSGSGVTTSVDGPANPIAARLRAKELHYGVGRAVRGQPGKQSESNPSIGFLEMLRSGRLKRQTTSANRDVWVEEQNLAPPFVQRPCAQSAGELKVALEITWPQAPQASASAKDETVVSASGADLSRLIKLVEATRNENFSSLLWPPSRIAGGKDKHLTNGGGGGEDLETKKAKAIDLEEQLEEMRALLFRSPRVETGGNEKYADSVGEMLDDSANNFVWPNELDLTYEQFRLIERFISSELIGKKSSSAATTRAVARRSIDNLPSTLPETPSPALEAQLAASRRRRREHLLQIHMLISKMTDGAGCLPRSHYDTERLNTHGCQRQLELWLQSSANILFVTGFCVLTVLKFCSLILLRLEISEMVHKIRVLKGMISERHHSIAFNQDLETYFSHSKSMCVRTAELTPARVPSGLTMSKAPPASMDAEPVPTAGAPSLPVVVPRRLGGSFSETVVAATAAASHNQRLAASENKHFQLSLGQYGRAGSLTNCAALCAFDGSTRTLGASGLGSLSPSTHTLLSTYIGVRGISRTSSTMQRPNIASSLSVAAGLQSGL